MLVGSTAAATDLLLNGGHFAALAARLLANVHVVRHLLVEVVAPYLVLLTYEVLVVLPLLVFRQARYYSFQNISLVLDQPGLEQLHVLLMQIFYYKVWIANEGLCVFQQVETTIRQILLPWNNRQVVRHTVPFQTFPSIVFMQPLCLAGIVL